MTPKRNWFGMIVIVASLYWIIEIILKVLHEGGHIDLGFLIPILERCDAVLQTTSSLAWTPISPIAAPLFHGLALKLFMTPCCFKAGVNSQGISIGFTVYLASLGLIWLKRGCSNMVRGSKSSLDGSLDI